MMLTLNWLMQPPDLAAMPAFFRVKQRRAGGLRRYDAPALHFHPAMRLYDDANRRFCAAMRASIRPVGGFFLIIGGSLKSFCHYSVAKEFTSIDSVNECLAKPSANAAFPAA